MNDCMRAEVEAKNELKEMKENAAKQLERKLQEQREKVQVDLLHYKNSLELIKRTHEEELKNAASEIIQVKSDARLVINFIRRKANEAIAEEAFKRTNQKKEMMERIKSQELQMKKSFNGHLESFEAQVKDIVRGGKNAFHTETTFTSATTTGPRIQKSASEISLLSNSSVIGEIGSDESITMDDSIASSMKDAKYNRNVVNENKLLTFRIKQLERWTDTLTIALRTGATIKGLNDKPSSHRDEVIGCKKAAGEKKVFVPKYVTIALGSHIEKIHNLISRCCRVTNTSLLY